MAVNVLAMTPGRRKQRLSLLAAAVGLLCAACCLAATSSVSASAFSVAQPTLRAAGDVRAPLRASAPQASPSPKALGQSAAAAGLPTVLLGAGLALWAAVSRSQRSAGRVPQAACRVSLASPVASFPLPVYHSEPAAAVCEIAEAEVPAIAQELPSLLPEVEEVVEVAPVIEAAPVAFGIASAEAPAIGQSAKAARNPLSHRAVRIGRARRSARNAYGSHQSHQQREERRNVGARLQERVVAEPRVMTYDASRVASKVQTGLQMQSLVRATPSREARVPLDAMSATLVTESVAHAFFRVQKQQRH